MSVFTFRRLLYVNKIPRRYTFPIYEVHVMEGFFRRKERIYSRHILQAGFEGGHYDIQWYVQILGTSCGARVTDPGLIEWLEQVTDNV